MLTYHHFRSSEIHIGAISQEISQPSIIRFSLNITLLKFYQNLPEVNELKNISMIDSKSFETILSTSTPGNGLMLLGNKQLPYPTMTFIMTLDAFHCHNELTHWSQDQIAAILQAFLNPFSTMDIVICWFEFHWKSIPKVQLMASHHWFSQRLGTEEAPSHFLNQLMMTYFADILIDASRCIYVTELSGGSGDSQSPVWCETNYLNLMTSQQNFNQYAIIFLQENAF